MRRTDGNRDSAGPATEQANNADDNGQIASLKTDSHRCRRSMPESRKFRKMSRHLTVVKEEEALKHDLAVRDFMLVDSQLTNKDRSDLERALNHVTVGSLLSGSAVGLQLAASTFRRSIPRLTLGRMMGKSAIGLVGLYVGTQIGMQLGCDIVMYKMQDRPACTSAIGLVLQHPIISKWARYYGGDRQLMVDLIRSPVSSRYAVGSIAVPDFSKSSLITSAVSSLKEQAPETMISKFEAGIKEYQDRMTLAAMNKRNCNRRFRIRRNERNDSNIIRGADTSSGPLMYRSFLGSYALYLSNDYRRPFF
ncbi:uncharacterized protein V1518DRAFT_403856 [Limtongia smithiae]|uniref:uncharacterized protein n=1 Tax=Limtongia smithiae TaxID=1125753 RepID=UPI0034CF93D0